MTERLQNFAWNMDFRDYYRFVQNFHNPVSHKHDRKCCMDRLIYNNRNENILYFYSGQDSGWRIARAIEDGIQITGIITDGHMAKMAKFLMRVRGLSIKSIRPFGYSRITDNISTIIVGPMAFVRYEKNRLQEFFNLLYSYGAKIILPSGPLATIFNDHNDMIMNETVYGKGFICTFSHRK